MYDYSINLIIIKNLITIELMKNEKEITTHHFYISEQNIDILIEELEDKLDNEYIVKFIIHNNKGIKIFKEIYRKTTARKTKRRNKALLDPFVRDIKKYCRFHSYNFETYGNFYSEKKAIIEVNTFAENFHFVVKLFEKLLKDNEELECYAICFKYTEKEKLKFEKLLIDCLRFIILHDKIFLIYTVIMQKYSYLMHMATLFLIDIQSENLFD